LIEAIQDQYLTRHLPDGRIIYTDHRISTVSGYIPSEVQGKSAFNFFYAEDLPWTTMALRHMFASSSGEGTTVYRLFSSTGELICLQTRGFLEYNKSKNKIESFLCINTLIKPEDQDRYLQEQKDKFTPFISELQMDADTKQEPRAIEKKPPSTSTSTSAERVSVISKVGPRPGGGCSAVARSHEHSGSVTRMLNTESMEEAVERQLMGKRRRPEEWGESEAKRPQYDPVREAPIHRVEDGVRIIDVENIGIESFDTRDNNETSFMNFEELISQFDYNNGAPDLTVTEAENPNINQRSVIQKISSCSQQVQAKPDFPTVHSMVPMMRCNTAQFSGAMEVETHGLGDDTGLDCFAAMSPDLADIELSRMVAVTTGQSLASDISSRRTFTAEDG